MSNLDELRKKKLEELMSSQQERLQEQAQMQQQVDQMENVVKQFLTKDALARYGNLKAAHKEMALQLLVVLLQAIQKGQVKDKIDDALLKKVLEEITPKKKEIKIKRV